MRKLLFTLALLFFSASCWAQGISQIGNPVDHGPTLPVTCTVAQIYKLTAVSGGNNPGLYECDTANTWSPAGSGGGAGGNVTGSPSSTIRLALFRKHNGQTAGGFWNLSRGRKFS